MRKKILLVEDDPDLLELIEFNLKAQGFLVGTALDGVEALRKARSIRPDLILLDVLLPELDGLAVCERLRHDTATASIPVVIISALSGQFARLAGYEAGAVDFVTKPFSFKNLISRINQLL